jgi:hypothetical protein
MKLTRRLLERMIREEYQQYYIAPEGTHLMPGATSDESGITMTDENYEKLMVLLNSDDRENVEMGIELADTLGFSLPPTEIPDNEEYEEFFVPSNDPIANSDIVYEWIYDRVHRAPLLDKDGIAVSQYERLNHKWTRVLEHLFKLVSYQSHDWVGGPRGLYKQDNENAGMNKEYYQEAALIVDTITERFVNAKFRDYKVPIRIDPDKPAGSLPRSNKSLSRELKSILRALAQRLPRGMAALAWIVKNRQYPHRGDQYPRDREGKTIADRKARAYNLTLPSRSDYMQDTWSDKIVDAYRRAKAFLTRNRVPTSTTTMSDKTWKDLPTEKK